MSIRGNLSDKDIDGLSGALGVSINKSLVAEFHAMLTVFVRIVRDQLHIPTRNERDALSTIHGAFTEDDFGDGVRSIGLARALARALRSMDKATASQINLLMLTADGESESGAHRLHGYRSFAAAHGLDVTDHTTALAVLAAECEKLATATQASQASERFPALRHGSGRETEQHHRRIAAEMVAGLISTLEIRGLSARSKKHVRAFANLIFERLPADVRPQRSKSGEWQSQKVFRSEVASCLDKMRLALPRGSSGQKWAPAEWIVEMVEKHDGKQQPLNTGQVTRGRNAKVGRPAKNTKRVRNPR